METLIKLNTQTAGRDKIARLLQYLSRVLWHRLQLSKSGGVDVIKNIEYQLSTFRKLLRFGRCIDTIYSIVRMKNPDNTIRITQMINKLYSSLFLFADHMLWLGRADICKVDTDKWSRLSNQYWMYSIGINLFRDTLEIINILIRNRNDILPQSGLHCVNDYMKTVSRGMVCLQKNRGVMVDTIKNSCDFFIPLNALGHITLSPGTIGCLGVVSSIAGLIALIDPLANL